MRPFKQLLPLIACLLAILFAGYGVGYLIGKKRGQENSATIVLQLPDTSQKFEQWQEVLLQELSDSLKLNRHQKQLIAAEIQDSAQEIHDVYLHDIGHIARIHLKLFDHLLPHLTQEQQEKLNKHRKSMEESLSSLL